MLAMTIAAALFALSTLTLALMLHAQTKSYNDVRFHVELAAARANYEKLLQYPPELRDRGFYEAQIRLGARIAELEEKLRQMGEVVD